MYTSPLPRLGIPALRMSMDRRRSRFGPTTAYTAGIALAASWDTTWRGAWERAWAMMLGAGRQIILGPGLNIYRAPMGAKLRVPGRGSVSRIR